MVLTFCLRADYNDISHLPADDFCERIMKLRMIHFDISKNAEHSFGGTCGARRVGSGDVKAKRTGSGKVGRRLCSANGSLDERRIPIVVSALQWCFEGIDSIRVSLNRLHRRNARRRCISEASPRSARIRWKRSRCAVFCGRNRPLKNARISGGSVR